MRLRWKIAQAAEIRWWQRYLKKKEPMEYLRWKQQYWQNFLTQCGLDISEKELRCLDAGCGPAGIFSILEGQKVDAIDPLLTQYETKLSAFQQTDYPWVKFHACPMEQFEPKMPYDLVFCLNAINHVSDWAGCIERLMSWIAPGGILLLSTDVHRHAWLKPIFRALPGDILHPQQHSLQEYLTELNKYHPKSVRTQLIKREGIFEYWAIAVSS